MKDDAMKKAGLPHSLSRKEEKKNKRNTDKKRRQGDRKEIQRGLTLKEFLVQESADAEIDCPVCGGTGNWEARNLVRPHTVCESGSFKVNY